MKREFFIITLVVLFSLSFISVQNQDSASGELRVVEAMHKPERADIQGLITYRVMPTSKVPMEQLDPFIFLNHHGPQTYPPNNQGLPFGPHPHRGFETVTFILEGDLVHADNSGHESKITAGGIQWMTAGKGVIHSELSSDEFKKEGGDVEMLQLWINLPAKHKDATPDYIGLQDNEIPELILDNGKAKVNLISGRWQDKEAPIESITDVMMSYLEMKAGAKVQTQVPQNREVFFYVVSGTVVVNEKIADKHALVEFAPEGKQISITCEQDAVVLYGHATPNREPIVSQGPFVMNSKEEIRQAYEDYRNGKFGVELK